jgi:MFS family permease
MAYVHVTGAGRVSGSLERRQLVRAAVGSTIGTTVEWYDVVLYALLVPFYLGHLFFPSGDPLASTLSGYLGLAVSFGARFVGAAFFGRFGDRVGRKATLVITLAVGGIASALIGLLPTYAAIGVVAPVLLLLLRACVGFALGGEWGGAVLLTLEWGNHRHRGLWSAFPQIGAVAATVLGFVAIAVSRDLVGPQSPWAWRLPFIASLALVAVGLYVRLGVLETPTFVHLIEQRRTERRPVRTVLRRNPGDVILTAMVKIGDQVPLVLMTTFFLVYTGALRVPTRTAISISIWSGLVGVVCTPLFGYLSDLVGRRRTYVYGALLMVAFALPYFTLVGTGDVSLILIAAVVAQVLVAAMNGPEAALIAETFTGRLRYSGASLGAGLGAPLGGGVASALGVVLLQRFHGVLPVALYMVACCLLGAVGVGLLKERRTQDLGVEYDDPHATAAAVAAGSRA